jgi:hypothetical protein
MSPLLEEAIPHGPIDILPPCVVADHQTGHIQRSTLNDLRPHDEYQVSASAADSTPDQPSLPPKAEQAGVPGALEEFNPIAAHMYSSGNARYEKV